MNLTGSIVKHKATSFATVTVTDGPDWAEVSVVIEGIEVVKFPLTLGLDRDVIRSKIGNVINQTGLVDRPVRVDLYPI